MVVIVFENTGIKDTLTQPTFSKLKERSLFFQDFHAVTHPSQPNYLAMISGDTHGVFSNQNVDLKAEHLGDRLEERGMNWKQYAEGYPEPTSKNPCFTGAKSLDPGTYFVRKHAPFLSFLNITSRPERCRKHVRNSLDFWTDLSQGKLPAFSFYVPDNRNSGHDTGVAFADRYLGTEFLPKFESQAPARTLLWVTFDENDPRADTDGNLVYSAFLMKGLSPKYVSDRFDFYSVLKLLKERFRLGKLSPAVENAQSMARFFQVEPRKPR
jgi:acid phosphatase